MSGVRLQTVGDRNWRSRGERGKKQKRERKRHEEHVYEFDMLVNLVLIVLEFGGEHEEFGVGYILI